MPITNLLKKFTKNYISFASIEDWDLINNKAINHKIYFANKKLILRPDVKNTKNVVFKTKNKFNKGWYLFCINHRGDNNRCFGTIRVGHNGFSQSRPMYPSKGDGEL